MDKKGKLYSIVSTFSDLVILGLLWLLSCIPIITVGPACTALYYAVAKTIRFESGRPAQEYFRAFRENFIAGLLTGIPYFLVLVSLLFFTVRAPDSLSRVTGGVFVLLLTGAGIYLFPLVSRFKLRSFQYYSVTLFFLMRYAGKTALLLFVFLLCGLVIYLLPFLLPVLAACYGFYMTFLVEPVFREYIEADASGSDEWYMRN